MGGRGEERYTNLTKFLLRIRGAFTDAPRIVEPVMNIPHAAPMMQRVKDSDAPIPAKKNGFTFESTVPQSLFPVILETMEAVDIFPFFFFFLFSKVITVFLRNL